MLSFSVFPIQWRMFWSCRRPWNAKVEFSDWFWHQGHHYYIGFYDHVSLPSMSLPKSFVFSCDLLLGATVSRQHCPDRQKTYRQRFGPGLCMDMRKGQVQLFVDSSLIYNIPSYTTVFIRNLSWPCFSNRTCSSLQKISTPLSLLLCPLHNLNWSPGRPSWWWLGGTHSCETSQPTRHLFRDLNTISPPPGASCSKAAFQGPPETGCQGHRASFLSRCSSLWPRGEIVTLLCLF